MKTTAVLGAGSWGTALAVHLATAGHHVRLWARDESFVEELRSSRENERYLPGIPLDDRIAATASLEEALSGARFVVVAVPSHGFRAVVRRATPYLSDAVLVSATKGIEVDSLQRMSQVIESETAGCCRAVVLSGPSFALETARGLPTAVIAASTDAVAAAAVQEHFRGQGLRLYVNDDVAGVEIGGALKNVIAIAAGVSEGLGLGHNTLAALITRGLAEISRLAFAEGGRRDTLAGLSGLGDLVLTCTGSLSRNRQVGVALGQGRSLDEVLSSTRMVAEGVRTTRAALALGARHGIELPIAAQMQAVIDGQCSPLDAVEALMGRRQRAEVDG
ncbi:MAG TPA: NAD(P)H-dependent glycerol-3-phosphate dehydrogenase [Vicinamibacterales bacterium]|nr:NAD(P)H-dependent glycerol-3-phosphate dehydrogenase [Vicinamibacterales bacterium]